jgi:acetolactate synthase-1/2/3 large subunit
MAKKQGGWLLAKTLYDMGVRDIFTLAGGHINPIYKACTDLGIRLIDTHHEQGAVMAADAYGRVTRTPGVCLVTAGPGLTNALTGLAGSYLSNSPMILIAGRSGIEENDKMSLQEIDQLAMVKPITKWARTIYDINRIPEYVSNSYKIANTGKPGPVYLGTSYEVLYPKTDQKDLAPYDIAVPVTNYEPNSSQIKKVLSQLNKAKRPIVIFGSGSWYSKSETELEEFIKNLNIPAFTLNMGRGIIPDKYCFGPASPSSPKGFREISGKSDLILLLGIRLSIYIGFGNSFNKKAKIVQVDINPDEISRNVKADCSVISDLKSFVVKMNDHFGQNPGKLNFKEWYYEATTIKNNSYKQFRKTVLNSRKKSIHPAKVAKVVSDFLGEEGIAVVDGGDCQSWTDVTYEVQNPGHYVKGGPLGCMGVGIPFALGTKAANPDKKVALITGDGAVAMNFMEIETAVKHKLPFVVVVCNDSAWGMTKHQIEITYPKVKKTQGVELGFVEFDKIAKAMGGNGETVTDIKKLEPALKWAFKSNLPVVINVKTDPEAVSGATQVITQMMMKGM